LLEEWGGAFGVPPFGRIKPDHFREAFACAFAAHAAEVAAIAGNAAAPTFDNTIAALEASGQALTQTVNVFNLLAGAHTNDAILAIERELAPLKAKHWDGILMDEALFGRVDSLYQMRDRLALSAEQQRVLERYHVKFTRAGAALDGAAKERLADINERLATLGTRFSQNLLADEQSYALVLDGEDDLAGLPDFVRAAARAAAEERGLAGKHVFTLSRSSVEPFLQFSTRRDLRGKIFAPGSRAATAAAQPTTKGSLPRW
jgi:peptidyl-dipeptidase Dcp